MRTSLPTNGPPCSETREPDFYQRGNFAFHGWIRDSLDQNKPYDQFVRNVVAASGEVEQHPPVAWYREVKTVQNQLEGVSQLFLGTRIQCAQYHHHPFEKWSQEDYYKLSAFFSQVGRERPVFPDEEMIFHKRGVARASQQKNNQPVQPAGLGADSPALTVDDDPRHALVDWMSKDGNPFFSHTLVNRYWKHFFGRGLVDPEDDMRETNPSVNPELLEELASHLQCVFDMKQLIRDIYAGRKPTSSAPSPTTTTSRTAHNFARHYPQRLQAEVLLDSIDDLTQVRTGFSGPPPGTRATMLPDNSYNNGSYFLSVFGRPDNASACECERSGDASLAQSLHLINSKDIQNKLSSGVGRACGKLAKDKDRTDAEKIEELRYSLAFARSPKKEELQLALDYSAREVENEKDKRRLRTKANPTRILFGLFSTTIGIPLRTCGEGSSFPGCE